jgi:uncharacterized protein YjbJ (UPF0337 family)
MDACGPKDLLETIASTGVPPFEADTRLSTSRSKEEPAMATTDKAKNTADLAQGKLKEAAGAMTGNDKLRAEGKAEQTKANLKQAREKVKDAFRK